LPLILKVYIIFPSQYYFIVSVFLTFNVQKLTKYNNYLYDRNADKRVYTDKWFVTSSQEVKMIEVKTKYTLEMHREFLRFLFFRGENYRYKRQSFSVLGILLFALWFVLYMTTPFSYIPAVLLAVGVFVLLWAHLIPAMLTKQNTKEASCLMQSGLDIVFDENDISISSEADSISGTSKLRYKALFKVYETKKDFYIFLTPVHVFLVSKRDFVTGAPDDLRTLFQSKIDDLFVICK